MVWALIAKCWLSWGKKREKKTLLLILRIVVRLLLLGLYKTAVETSLRILNCENFEGNLVWKDNKPANLYELDVFGEGALFSSSGRSATVTAEEDVEVLVLSRNALKLLLRSKILDKSTVMELKKVAEERKSQNEMLVNQSKVYGRN